MYNSYLYNKDQRTPPAVAVAMAYIIYTYACNTRWLYRARCHFGKTRKRRYFF